MYGAVSIRAISSCGTPTRPMNGPSSSTHSRRAGSAAASSLRTVRSNAACDGCGPRPIAPKADPRWTASRSRSSTCSPAEASSLRSSVLPAPVRPATTTTPSAGPRRAARDATTRYLRRLGRRRRASAVRTRASRNAQDDTSLLQNFFLPPVQKRVDSAHASLLQRNRLDHVETQTTVHLTAAGGDAPRVPYHGAPADPARAPQCSTDDDAGARDLLFVDHVGLLLLRALESVAQYRGARDDQLWVLVLLQEAEHRRALQLDLAPALADVHGQERDPALRHLRAEQIAHGCERLTAVGGLLEQC